MLASSLLAFTLTDMSSISSLSDVVVRLDHNVKGNGRQYSSYTISPLLSGEAPYNLELTTPVSQMRRQA